MATRKKWSTTWSNPALGRSAHRSEKAAYAWISEQATALREGRALRSTIVNVWVDEGLGRGWERYERVDLREHGAAHLA